MKKFFKNLSLVFIFSIVTTCLLYSQQAPQEWTILETYTIPGKASGLAWDGQYLYSGLYSSPGDDNFIYRIDPSDGSYTLHCTGPMEKCYGLTWDSGSGNLWTTDHPSANQAGIAIEFEMNGDYVSEFDLPETYFSGIAYDNGNFWTTCYYDPDGEVYKLDASGIILDQFAAPGEQPWDICKQGSDLWIVDYDDNKIFKIDQDGNLLESYDSENIKPAGIVFDGTYLWYVDGGLQVSSSLYKIDLSGAGNPDIEVPVTDYDYSIVTIDETSTWGCLIQNNGTADLEITYGAISGQASEYIGWPTGTSLTIPAGETQVIDIDYTPGEEGELDAVATLETNDPVTPEVELHMTGNAVYSGPHLEVLIDNHNYGNVRVGAHTRWQVEVVNKGDEILEITNLTLSETNNYYADQRITFPVSLASLETARLGIWFAPDADVNEYPCTATIFSNDPDMEYALQLDGSGLLKDWEMGEIFWQYTIEDPFDASPKAMSGIQDVTGDGIEDVIVCSEDDFVRCFNGNSHGQADMIWEKEIPGGSVYHQNSISRIMDIDDDGYEDIIIGTAWADRSIIALSGYSGEQIWKYHTNEFGDGGWVYQVSVDFDYNNDQFPDVLAATGDDSNDTGPKRAFCLNGKTGMRIWDSPFTGPVFSVIGIEDFTGDGKPDAIAGVSNATETEGSFYSIDGSSGLSKWHFVTNGTAVWALTQIDDVNENGTKDIFAGVNNGEYYTVDPKTLFILKNGTIGSSSIVRCQAIDDITRDGYKDILLANSSNRAIVLDGAEGGYAMNLPVADKCWVVDRIDDLSGDEINDVVAGTLFNDNYTYFIDTQNFEAMFEDNYSEPLDAIKSINDINGDWSMEIVAGGRNGKIKCYSGGLDAPVGTNNRYADQHAKMEHGSYPNPFSNQVALYIKLNEPKQVTISIYDQQGRLVEQIASEHLEAGKHQFQWDASKQATQKGIYFYNILTPQTVVSGKLIKL